MIITLTEAEIELAKDYANKRIEFNKKAGNRDIADYDPKRFNLSSLQNNFMAILGEIGLCKLLDLDYTDPEVYCGYSENYADFKKPDVVGVFEMRRLNKPTNPLAVRTKDVKAKAIIVIGHTPYEQLPPEKEGVPGKIVNYGEVHFKGWMPAQEAWNAGKKAPWSDKGDSRIVEQSDINTDFGQLWEHYKEHYLTTE